MQPDEIVRVWHSLATGGQVDQSDVFFKFIALWVAFNALYAAHHSSVDRDWDQLSRFADDADALQRHAELLRIDSDYKQAIGAIASRGVVDLRHNNRRSIGSQRGLTEVLSCVYQVRCNLFHGGKTPESPRDKLLVHAAYTVVAKLIQPFVEKLHG